MGITDFYMTELYLAEQLGGAGTMVGYSRRYPINQSITAKILLAAPMALANSGMELRAFCTWLQNWSPRTMKAGR